MATTKIWKVVKRLDHVMDYATDETKTKNIEFRVEKGNYLVLVNDLKDFFKGVERVSGDEEY